MVSLSSGPADDRGRPVTAGAEAGQSATQQALGITVDGIVGPVTWRALVSGMLSF